MLPSSARIPQPSLLTTLSQPSHCSCRQTAFGGPCRRPLPLLWLAAAECRARSHWVDRSHSHSNTGVPFSHPQRAGAGLHRRRAANAPFGSQRAPGHPQSQPQRAISPGDRQDDGRAYNAQPRPPLPRQRPGPQRPLDYRQQSSAVQLQEPASSSQGLSHDSRSVGRPQLGLQQQQQRQQQEPRLQPQRTSYSRGTRVHFSLQYHTNYGERIRLVGSHESLGVHMPSPSAIPCRSPLTNC